MKDPTDRVVNKLGLGECLVATFVSYDPKAGHDETVGERIEGPERNPSEGVEVRTWQVDVLRGDKRVDELC